MKAYFLSDLHLGAPYFADSRESEMRVVRFLDSIKDDADVIYLLGDILDYWYEYRYVVPRGFVRFFGKLAELSDRGVRIVWFIGNHDIWIFDYLPAELGIEVVDGILEEEIDGRHFVMSHGDGIGKLKPSFKLLRRLFRSKTCQFLFSAIHPRWTVPFAYNWSRHSRKCEGPSEADAKRMLRNVTDFSEEYLSLHPEVNYFLYGHLHLLRRYEIICKELKSKELKSEREGDGVIKKEREGGEAKAEIIILGEWINTYSYALWDGKNLSLNKYEG